MIKISILKPAWQCKHGRWANHTVLRNAPIHLSAPALTVRLRDVVNQLLWLASCYVILNTHVVAIANSHGGEPRM